MSADALISKYEALLQSRPNDELIRFSLGKAYLDVGRVDDAKAQLQLALDAKPDWMIVTMLLAKIAQQQGDNAAARDLWQKGLQLAIDQHHDDPAEECRAELAKLQA